MTLPFYEPIDWFWSVGGDQSRAWSSAAGAYVSEYPTDRVTPIASEQELNAVLRPYGLMVPSPDATDYEAAVQAHVDATARARSYNSGISCAGYATSSVPKWGAEATTFIAWRDAVWTYVFSQLAAVQAQQRAKPSVAGLIAELPAIAWPV